MKPYKKLLERIQRDKARKAYHRHNMHMEHDGLTNIVTYGHWARAAYIVAATTAFKRSVQVFLDYSILRICAMIRTITDGGIPDVATDRECIIRERGKRRKITPVIADDRSMQHVLSDNGIMPMLMQRVIRTNCANQAGKGTSDARRLLNRYLELAKRQWTEIWILTFDFKGFFDSIRHAECKRALELLFWSPKIIRLAMLIIISYQMSLLRKRAKEDLSYTPAQMAADQAKLLRWEGKGICLGSQISQDMAILVPDPIDKHIKQTMPYYIRFADDGIIIWHNREDLVRLRSEISTIAETHGLRLHPNKTQIVRAAQGFTFLKTRYRIKGKKTIKRLDRSGINRMRRKLQKYRHLVDEGRMTLDDVCTSLSSWQSHTTHTKCTHTVKAMDELYEELFGRR